MFIILLEIVYSVYGGCICSSFKISHITTSLGFGAGKNDFGNLEILERK